MNISITYNEFSSVNSAIDFIGTSLQAANEESVKSYSPIVNDLYNICNKYKKAREQENCLKLAMKVIRKESNAKLSRNQLLKIARKVVKKCKSELPQ